MDRDFEAVSFLGLCDLPGVGFETLKKVSRARLKFSSFFDPAATIRTEKNASFGRISDALKSPKSVEFSLNEGRRKLEYLRKKGIHLIFQGEDGFPNRLSDLQDPPLWIFVEGSIAALQEPAVAAIGSRKVSADGKWLATYFGYCLSELKVVTVSGLAEGVDQIIHRASLAAGLPTVAVLGTGILLNYPRDSEGLRKDIVNGGGAIVTEYLPNDSFSARNFVRRNRIQAALGHIVFPVEWGVKSGTAHTVKFASDLGRPLLYARTPMQPELNWIPAALLKNSTRLCLPRDHDKFMATLRNGLVLEAAQKSLF
ncbi:DNA-processing protein DprA [Paracoccus yeei]|uniref:DNA-processing protein DprA n=1 Tax=Paracoccus yeei TaxID=147645 RepID=UPI0037D242A6